jgi:hypothetical protein
MTKHHPDGVLNFDYFEHDCQPCKLDPKFCFTITMRGKDQEFTFKCPSPKDLIQWKSAIASQIMLSEGKKQRKSALDINDPWKYDNISEDHFR